MATPKQILDPQHQRAERARPSCAEHDLQAGTANVQGAQQVTWLVQASQDKRPDSHAMSHDGLGVCGGATAESTRWSTTPGSPCQRHGGRGGGSQDSIGDDVVCNGRWVIPGAATCPRWMRPQPERVALAIDRGLRYLDSGVPDLLWCEFPTADREPLETFTTEIRRRFLDARFAFNYSSSFKWFKTRSR